MNSLYPKSENRQGCVQKWRSGVRSQKYREYRTPCPVLAVNTANTGHKSVRYSRFSVTRESGIRSFLYIGLKKEPN